MKYLSFWNHNSEGNPHNQYVVNDSDRAIRPFNFDKDKCWFKLFTIYLPDLKKNEGGYGQFEMCFDVYDVSDFGGHDTDSHWELFFKAGTARTDFFTENGITVKLAGENRRCVVTCTPEVFTEEVRNTYVDEDGTIQHELDSKKVYKYRYDLYVKMKAGIYQRSYFVKKFASVTSEDYKIYDMTSCYSLVELDLDNTKHYISTNNDKLIYDEHIVQDNNNYTKLFNIDLSFLKNFYINYSGIFEIATSYNYENKDLADCKPQYIKFLVTAVNTSSAANEKCNYNLNVNLLESMNYNDNIIYEADDTGLISFWFKSQHPVEVTLFRKDNDQTARVFTLELPEMVPASIDESKSVILKEN